MKIVSPDTVLDIPPEVQTCPYCGGKLAASFTGWTEAGPSTSSGEPGGWIADEVSLDCETEPEIDSDEWDDWWSSHSEMPYVYMLPACQKVEAWLKEHYRFDLSDSEGDLNAWNEAVKDWVR